MAEYGDTHEERARELMETGVSVRHRSHPSNPEGKGILQLLREALDPENDKAADEPRH